MSRVGNLVILPYTRMKQSGGTRRGASTEILQLAGGLSREEMETLLLALPYGY